MSGSIDRIYECVKTYEVSVALDKSQVDFFAQLDAERPGTDNARTYMGGQAINQLSNVLRDSAEFRRYDPSPVERDMGLKTTLRWTIHFVDPSSVVGNALKKARNDALEEAANLMESVAAPFEAKLIRQRIDYG